MRTQQLYIDGAWVPADSTKLVHDLWNNDVIGEVAVATALEADNATDAAARAMEAPITVPERAAILHRVADIVDGRAEEFAQMIRAEVGKPITAARLEVSRASGTFRLSAEEAKRLPGETVPLDAVEAGAGTFAFTISEPRGIVAAVTPFNFPLNLVAHKLGPALAAGCAVVLKPSDRAPLTAGLLIEAFIEAGLPAGWLNLVTGPAQVVVGAWQADPRVEIVTFTGSSRIGWKLKAESPQKLHILELGSNTAMVVDESADLDRALDGAISAGFANSGQACVSLQRIYVHTAVAASFISRLGEAVSAVRSGDPNDASTIVGPLVSEADAKRVVSWIDEATTAGATLVVGGTRVGSVVSPTLIQDSPANCSVMREEVFGPVITVNVVDNLSEGVAEVNRSNFGLNTSIFTGDLSAAMAYARDAQSGSVLVNMPPAFRADHMPYGGVKDSGQGREGVKYAVEEMVRQKLVVLKA